MPNTHLPLGPNDSTALTTTELSSAITSTVADTGVRREAALLALAHALGRQAAADAWTAQRTPTQRDQDHA